MLKYRIDYFELVFQGGTSLSKGYGLINRLSEDVDFRVIAKPACSNLGKEAKRRELRLFRRSLINTLINAGFDIHPQNVRVFYEGRYMSIRAKFEGGKDIVYLKPHIAIDCFLGTLELAPEIRSISSMVKVTLGDTECDHPYFPVPCVALDESAAEKWVALSRRIMDAKETPRDSDKHLVRHLYDLYQLQKQNCLSDHYHRVLQRILEKEQAIFSNEIFDSLNKKSTSALHYLCSDPKWKVHCQFFLEQMVYQSEKPDFEQAIAVVEKLNYI